MDAQYGQLIVLANRAPDKFHYDAEGRRVVTRAASGVVNAVEPLLRGRSGVWVAQGSTGREPAEPLEMRTASSAYRLRHVFLDELERRGFYEGFANGALWPLCHRTGVEPTFYATDFQHYELVNRRFADAVVDEASGPSPVIFVQDYHFALAPALLRTQLPQSRIATFWHIPWPRPEKLELCPWSRCLVDGLLGSTVIGFQTAADRSLFYEAVDRVSDAEVARGDHVIVAKGRRIRAEVYPASIDWPGRWADGDSVSECRTAVRHALGLGRYVTIAVGVDRLDYTKGLEQKCLAIERMLERRRSLNGRFALVQVAEPTREALPAYQQMRTRLLENVDRINRRFGGVGPGPIILLEKHHEPEAIARLYRAADACYVGSLHDGMNLVSKEFVCARDDDQGVLVLSAFAGSAHELTDAIQVNPYDIDATAEALARALEMRPLEQGERMRRMRRIVASADAHQWARRILADVTAPPPVRMLPQRPVVRRIYGAPPMHVETPAAAHHQRGAVGV